MQDVNSAVFNYLGLRWLHVAEMQRAGDSFVRHRKHCCNLQPIADGNFVRLYIPADTPWW